MLKVNVKMKIIQMFFVEHLKRVELLTSDYETDILPLNYRCIWWEESVSNRYLRIFSPLHKPSLLSSHMVCLTGFEPATYGLKVRYSTN